MTSNSNDDRPLTSEEMIKQARSDLDRRPGIEEMQSIDTDQIRQEVEQEMPSPDELIAPVSAPRTTPTRPRRRVTRADRTFPSGFGEDRPQSSANSIAVAVAVALLVIGVAMFLVVAASSTG